MKYKVQSLIVLFFMTFVQYADAQVGIRAGYNIHRHDNWNLMRDYTTTDRFIQSSYEVGVNYKFRLPKIRIEFLPEIVAGLGSKSNVEYKAEQYKFDYKYFDFRLNTQFYILSLKENCDCPTFTNKKNTLADGLFVFVSPGVRYGVRNESLKDYSQNNITFNIGAGVGFDIPINKDMSVTPILGYRAHFGDQWNQFIFDELDIEKENYWSDINMSVRFSYNMNTGRR